jgi:glutamyl-tRNA reductase
MPLRLLGLEFSLETAPLDALERLARGTSREHLRNWFSQLEETEEAALLSTCHRVELVLLVASEGEVDRWREVLPGPREGWRFREGRAVVRHLFEVAAGRASLARGEGEVRHQVRAAGRQVVTRHPRPVLRELFSRAADAAEELDPAVPASRSIAAVAATRLLALVNRPRPRVLVIGSGTVGRQLSENLSGHARVTMLFHRNPPEAAFLAATGAKAERLDRLPEELRDTDAAVTAAKFGDRGLRASDMPRDHALLLIDLGMPRNIDPDVRELSNVRLVDLEDLYESTSPGSATESPDTRLAQWADQCSDRIEFLLLEPWVTALRRAAEELRRSELEWARPFLGTLDPNQEVAIERLTQRLVARLLLPPTERIRSLPLGPVGDLQRRLAVELFRPLSPDP